MKAYLIDPFAKTITDVDYNGDYRSIHKLVECETFSSVQITSARDTVFVDDCGLLKPFHEQRFFMIDGYPNPLAGKGLVLGCNDYGESTSPTITIHALRKLVKWADHQTVAAYANAGAFDVKLVSDQGVETLTRYTGHLESKE